MQVSRGRSVLVTGPAGMIDGDRDHGFFVHETRLLSQWRHAVDGGSPQPVSLSHVDQSRWLGYYVLAAPKTTMPPEDDGSGQVPSASRNTLELRVSRVIDGGMHEDLDFTNYTMESTSFVFAIDVDSDFVDQSATQHPQNRPGTVRRAWSGDAATLRCDYTAGHGTERGTANVHRTVEIRIVADGVQPEYADGRFSFAVSLPPRGALHVCIRIGAEIDGALIVEPGRCHDLGELVLSASAGTRIESIESEGATADVLATLAQAANDLLALRLPDLDRGAAWTVAAGLPQYVALFGRDTLTAGWQAGILGPELLTGALHVLAERQGTKEDDWYDEQPGKMLHEAHTGPLSALDFNPRARSYSSITTAGLYAFAVAELWHWTGDRRLVRQFVEPALRAVRWLDRYGDLDGDGFYEYQSKSPLGPRNQAWKDSPDAIVYEDGSLVEPPIATCEEHAFVYAAKLHLSETLWWLGEPDLARRLYTEASELKKRFHEAFWMEDEGFYALALDAQKRQVRSITSNPGHCVAAAIADAEVVPRIVDRLFAPDLFSGWGIRTLSSSHPRYNPYSYHLGSVWPVEQGTFAIGFMRYGLHERAAQLARAVFDAATLFELHRLPELFGGHPRDAMHPFPGIYPNASSPQAWSASSVFSLLQALLGLYPYAPLSLLVLDPHLPEWLPALTLRDLRVGKAQVTIRFRRNRDGRTGYRILDQHGTLHVVRQATPWSLTAQPAERLRDALESLLPGH